MNTEQIMSLAEKAAVLDHNENADWYSEELLSSIPALSYKKNARFIAACTPAAFIALVQERDVILQAVTDPENQPSQFGTVTLAMYEALAQERDSAVKAAKYAEHIDATPENQRETMLYDALKERDALSKLADKWNLECDELREDNKRLAAERDAAQADALEQARLCGMGGEREADLLGKVARLERERDELKNDLIFVERWAVHHAIKPHMTPEAALSCIAHYPPIRAITKAYSDGVFSSLPNPYEERDALKAELEDERTRGLQLLADAKEWQQQFIGAQAEVRELKAEVKTLRDALIHIQQVACSESPELSIASAALGETK